ncbi:MAG TPA: TRAP transporter large permease subunit [Afipia sp.]
MSIISTKVMKFGSTGIGSFADIGRWILAITESASAAALILLNVIVLCAVVSRYVFHSPIIWADELLVLVFFWMCMLGAVAASGRLEHIRMSGLSETFRPENRSVVAHAMTLAEILLFVFLINPAIHHSLDEAFISSPTLEISNFWKSLALPVSMGLIVVLSGLRLAAIWNTSSFLRALVIVVSIVAMAYLFSGLANTIGNYELLIFFGLLAGGAILLGFPIAMAFLGSAFAYLTFVSGAPLTIVPSRMEAGMSQALLLSIPAFVLLGSLLTITGMAKAMIDFVAAIVGHRRSGLDYVLIIAMFLISGISGSKSADLAAVAPALFPEMKRRGGKPGEMVALLAATGVQTETIPPSLVLIAIGSVTTVSISDLFAGGIIPAIFMGLVLASVVFLKAKQDVRVAERPSARVVCRLLLVAMPALALPILIRAAVVEGIATASEVATLGVAYSVIFAIFASHGRVSPLGRPMWRALKSASSLTGAIMLIVGGVTPMAFALTQSGFSTQLVQSVGALPGGAITFIAVSIVVFIILGAVLEGLPAMVLFAPLMFPLAQQLGINEVHYAVICIFSMGIGLFAPPFGVGYYIACAISDVDPREGIKPLMIYLAALLLGLVVVAAVPAFSTIRL